MAVVPGAAEPAVRPPTALIALVVGAACAVLQPLVAAHSGTPAWEACWCFPRRGWSAELMAVSWFAASSVVFGATVPRLVLRYAAPHIDLGALAGAALGGLLAIPVASSSAAWAALYGDGGSPWQAGGYAALGVVVGGVVALAAQRFLLAALVVAAISFLVVAQVWL